ncbi:MAG TPA: hypothetical protein VN954_10800 [Ktedonobacteraceae bacterium]|nr:hypothetical protein [Ktedonobacteraceae bacterium]
MQQAQQRTNGRGVPAPIERISWARSMIFAAGFFFLAALLIGQIPGYINLAMTASSLVGFEQGILALAVVCLAGFIVIQVVVMLFDPKPVIPPIVLSVLGIPIAIAGLAIILWASYTNNQYFPAKNVTWFPLLGGNVLWFPPFTFDLIMLAAAIMGVGVILVFFSILAIREQRNPDRHDAGTTPAIRALISIGITFLIVFMLFYMLVSPQSFAASHGLSLAVVNTIYNAFLGIAILCTLSAFALRFHYLLRPVRNRTMSGLYLVGINLAQFGVIFLLAWFLVYPAIAWIHTWTFIGLGSYLTICGKATAVPQSCSFSQQAGYIINAAVTTVFFVLMMAGIAVWKSRRNLVVVSCLSVTAVLAMATLLVHMHPDEIFIAELLTGGMLVLAVIWTSVARREFAVVGERNLGCVGQWLVVGTCLFIYIASFAFFSIPGFRETEPNIPSTPGTGFNAGISGGAHAIVVFFVIGILAAIQFYFLVRNRYRV